LITLVNIIIICFLSGFIYETRFSRFSPFPVNGLTTFYHCGDDILSGMADTRAMRLVAKS